MDPETESEDITIGEFAKKRGRGRPRKIKPPVETAQESQESQDTEPAPPVGDKNQSWKSFWSEFYSDEAEDKAHREFHSKGSKNSINPYILKGLGIGALTGLMLYLQTKNDGATVPSAPVNTDGPAQAITAAIVAADKPVESVESKPVESKRVSKPDAWNRSEKNVSRW